jgi:hypothetical protein
MKDCKAEQQNYLGRGGSLYPPRCSFHGRFRSSYERDGLISEKVCGKSESNKQRQASGVHGFLASSAT